MRRRVSLSVFLCVTVPLILTTGCGQNGNSRPASPVVVPSSISRVSVRVLSYTPAVLSSVDGGATWAKQRLESGALVRAIAFADFQHGWVVGDGTVMATANGGTTWITQRSGQGTLLAVASSDRAHVWAVGTQADGLRGLALTTSDGGAIWQEQRVPGSARLTGVTFSDALHGWAVGDDVTGTKGCIFCTSDGGAHWRVQETVVGADLRAVAFSDARHGWVVGGASQTFMAREYSPGLILGTNDGGTHWTTELSGTANALVAVAFPDSRHGWAVGYGGEVLATSDGGSSWSTVSLESSPLLLAVAFSDAQHGWTIDHTTLFATTDGGTEWKKVVSIDQGGPPGVLMGIAVARSQ
jgi:photosystem II stability/assembly factor-like uncharacterized protein